MKRDRKKNAREHTHTQTPMGVNKKTKNKIFQLLRKPTCKRICVRSRIRHIYNKYWACVGPPRNHFRLLFYNTICLALRILLIQFFYCCLFFLDVGASCRGRESKLILLKLMRSKYDIRIQIENYRIHRLSTLFFPPNRNEKRARMCFKNIVK